MSDAIRRRSVWCVDFLFFFFQAEDGIRDSSVTGVQTCALPILACSIPLVLAAVFVGMEFAGIDLQRVSLGALIIALGLLVDDAMITVETMVTQLEAGAGKTGAATFAFTSPAVPMLPRTLGTGAG